VAELLPRDWIIAHRCVDLTGEFGAGNVEKLVAAGKSAENSLLAMEARFHAGFGVEIDLRGDARSVDPGILISHDPPVLHDDYPTLPQVFELYERVGKGGCLALNVKDSGLQKRLKPLLSNFGVANYFTFDGAVADVMTDGIFGISAFGRESEIERYNSALGENPLPNYATVAGVWLDNFHPCFWIDQAAVERHFAREKDVALVSPELHAWGREDEGAIITSFWTRYREMFPHLREKYPQRRMLICTKFPTLAQRFFNAQN
jgi:hypothetical protein